jgi:uncharacterized membrane protein
MDQQGADEQEWKNQDNWAGPAYCRCYFSKKDRRLWVPKSNPNLGWTVNFGHQYGFLTLMVILMVPVFGLMTAVIMLKYSLCRGHGF